MGKKFYCLACAILLFSVFGSALAMAGEVDILIDKLVDKGVLTPEEGRDILQETRQESQRQHDEIIRDAKRESQAMQVAQLPQWIRDTKVKGDFRLRYQSNRKHGTADRHRGRYRLRVGVFTKITDTVQVGFGLATGNDNPRSTNQTMTNSFESPDLRLDYAFVSWHPWQWLTLTGGKFQNPVWYQKYFLWDTDIRPEGISATMRWQAGPAELFCTSGFWLVDERSDDEQDPVMIVLQPGWKMNFGEWGYFKNAATLYLFDNVEGRVLDHSSGTNALDAINNTLRHDYDIVVIGAELGLQQPLGMALFGEYINNWNASSDDSGYLLGVRLGAAKVRKKGQWKLGASYRRIERDAWLDIFPDADVYGGGTNVQGWQVGLDYGLCKGIWLTTNYFYMERISGASLSEKVLQVDVNIAF